MRPKRTSPVWRCIDEDAFCRDASSKAVESFPDERAFTSWMRSVMDPWTDTRMSAERRRHWEPTRVKALRLRMRNCTDETEREQLRRQIVSIRVQLAKVRNSRKTAEELKQGKAKSVKSTKLFTISSMSVDGQPTENVVFSGSK